MSYIGIEAGGTKVVCAAGTGPADLHDIVRIPTTTPDETLGHIADYLRAHMRGGVDGVGLAAFGPVDLDPLSPSYGHLTTTPKPGWRGADLLGPLRAVVDQRIGLDTDVNGAALGEQRWGAAVGLGSAAYITVGTGVGGGAIVGGQPVHGLLHPEMGHVLVRRHPDDPFEGRCPSHGDCLEGLAAGPAWMERWGQTSADMDAATLERAVAIQADYLAQLAMTLVLTLSPERIIFGGGVLSEPSLLPAVRRRTVELLDGYVAHPAIVREIDRYIVPPGLGDRAGVLGALVLAGA